MVSKMDKLGNWLQFTLCLNYSKGKHVYEDHTLVTGTKPVPRDANGTCNVGGWSFYYNG